MPKIERYFFEAKNKEKDMITVNIQSCAVTNHYYNPDSNEGGQWVEQQWDEELLERALSEFKNCDKTRRFSRPDCLDSDARTYLIDITSDGFDDYEKELISAFKSGELIIIEDSCELEKAIKDALLKMHKMHIRKDELISEICPHCENENTLYWNEAKDGYKAFCPHCGKKMMMCSACLNAADNIMQRCNWDEIAQSCFRCEDKEEIK